MWTGYEGERSGGGGGGGGGGGEEEWEGGGGEGERGERERRVGGEQDASCKRNTFMTCEQGWGRECMYMCRRGYM